MSSSVEPGHPHVVLGHDREPTTGPDVTDPGRPVSPSRQDTNPRGGDMSITTARQRRGAPCAGPVPLDDPRGVFGRLLAWYARRTYGDVPDNGLALLHHVPMLKAVLGFERRVATVGPARPGPQGARADSAAPRSSAARGAWTSATSPPTARACASTRSRRCRDGASPTCSPRVERRVLEYAEAMTATPPAVTDAMADALRADLGVDGFVELTMMVAVENERSRFNSALGLTSQGFADRCELSRPMTDGPTPSRSTAACCSRSPTRCSAASPTPRTCSRTRGCAGPTST